MTPPPQAPVDVEALLTRIEAELRRQNDDLEELQPSDAQSLGRDVELLAGAFSRRPPNAAQARRIAQVRSLHQRLSLALAQRRGELLERLARIGTGKKAARAYGRNAAT
jgi:hypothetical protein